jgi:hypothetical protein
MNVHAVFLVFSFLVPEGLCCKTQFLEIILFLKMFYTKDHSEITGIIKELWSHFFLNHSCLLGILRVRWCLEYTGTLGTCSKNNQLVVKVELLFIASECSVCSQDCLAVFISYVNTKYDITVSVFPTEINEV